MPRATKNPPVAMIYHGVASCRHDFLPAQDPCMKASTFHIATLPTHHMKASTFHIATHPSYEGVDLSHCNIMSGDGIRSFTRPIMPGAKPNVFFCQYTFARAYGESAGQNWATLVWNQQGAQLSLNRHSSLLHHQPPSFDFNF
jgi:hypothetical protein